jgi:Protein of unknown function (DUF1592)/Protein of unknown function (DUF1588)/Protein of unknown function (DUF1595)/Protein of unknown function (DUF1585)/Protein of unknown function (DUF1587)
LNRFLFEAEHTKLMPINARLAVARRRPRSWLTRPGAPLASFGLAAALIGASCTGKIDGGTPATNGSGAHSGGSASGGGGNGSPASTGGTGSGARSGTGGASSGAGTGAVSGSGGGTAGPGAGGASVADPNAAGPLPVRRLTAREYLNTVRDLLGDTSLAPGDLPGETDDLSNNGFPFRQPTTIATLDATNIQEAAESLAKAASTKLSSILPCTPANASAEASCANQFVTTFGLKVYRRPPNATEIADLKALYDKGRMTLGLDFNGAIGLLIEAMLQAPQFLYHSEVDAGPAVKDAGMIQLGNYQVASRLSYFLWGSMPDATLFQAAGAGQLSTAAGIETQAKRMLADDKARDGVADFVDDLFDVNVLASRPKDMTVYSTWNQDLASAMETEVRTFAVSNILGTGLLSDLLTGTTSSVNQSLAAVYGVSGVSGTAPKTVTLNSSQRGGLLTLAGFLAATGAADGSSPVRRGHAVFTRLLCGVLPNPPPNVPPVQPPAAGLTTRERFEQHDQNACTGTCHSAMDPIGFAFEHYDGIGQFRMTDQNLPVSASGSITLDGQKQSFADAIELGRLLAASPQVQSCFATQVTRYALNRWDVDADAASIQAAAAAFKTGGFDIRALMTAVATTRTFRYRAPSAGEVLP